MADQAAAQSLFDEVPAADLGSIGIRVVVLPPLDKKKGGKADAEEPEVEFDLDDDGALDGGPIRNYLESGRGKNCCVFLINGQRQDALDKTFIMRELDFKYIASRMMIMVDLDGLSSDAMRSLMQGSRQALYKGEIWEAILARVAATLKKDPELLKLEQEAEQKVSELQAGDEKVRQALDQLIDAHHDKGLHVIEGSGASDDSGDDSPGFRTLRRGNVVMLIRTGKGADASLPALVARPASGIHVVPGEQKQIIITAKPADAWEALATRILDKGTVIPGLQIVEEPSADRLKIKLLFQEPEGFDKAHYPVHGKLAVSARFNGVNEWRRVEIGFLIAPAEEEPEPVLFDEPTVLKVVSRSPVSLWKAPAKDDDDKGKHPHGDTHVRLKWDGKDSLLAGPTPKWRFTARVISPEKAAQPTVNFSMPNKGRFTMLVSPLAEWKAGQEFTFEVTATHDDGRKLSACFVGQVAEYEPEPEAKPRLVEVDLLGGRRSPYDLVYIDRKKYEEIPCWDGKWWSDADAACFLPPTANSPLRLIINTDMTVLAAYKKTLTKKHLNETTIERKITKYTSHVAYHLYQMYQATLGKTTEEPFSTAEERRSEEIGRVAVTLIRLMD